MICGPLLQAVGGGGEGWGGGDKRRAGRKFDVLPGPEPDWNHEMEINNVSAAKKHTVAMSPMTCYYLSLNCHYEMH